MSTRQTKLKIDLSGPQGNVFYLLGTARVWAFHLGLDIAKIEDEMMASDYKNALEVFKRYFKGHVEFTGE